MLVHYLPRAPMTSIFEGQPPPKQGRNANQNRGHLGSRIYVLVPWHVNPAN